MNKTIQTLIDRLEQNHALTEAEYAALITGRTEEAAVYLAEKARRACHRVYGNQVYIRGLIEVSNICRNDCLYCGIRRSNTNCARYRLTAEQILSCCRSGYALGFRTFVLQGGETDTHKVDAVCRVVQSIKAEFPDCAVTLSLGEYPTEAYQAMFDAGADRYLLRHETRTGHIISRCIRLPCRLTTGCAACVTSRRSAIRSAAGSWSARPDQTAQTLAKDLKFVETFAPAMCGIGPFIPHRDTPFRDKPAGSVELTLYLLSILRLIRPTLLLPATTALGTLRPDGRERGMLAGANVVMPNLSPPDAREKYTLYNGKLHSGAESAQHVQSSNNVCQQSACALSPTGGDAAAG